MSQLDPFTARRLTQFVMLFRERVGQLPALRDFEAAGIDRETVERGVKAKVLEQFYVTLTNGTVVKGFKVARTDLR
jgi:hypothetical protein